MLRKLLIPILVLVMAGSLSHPAGGSGSPASPAAVGSSVQSLEQPASRTFPETGKTVSGKFLQYWDGHGGLAQQGYPISDEMQEVSEIDGKSYTVQYFERAVFELHPENQPPSDVLLSLLGVFRYKQNYPNGAPNQTPDIGQGSVLFKETGHRLGGEFYNYWTTHGGLAQQGYPISDPFWEKSDLDGKMYIVQYFERAVFESHPENIAPYNILLSQLGTFQYKDKYEAKSDIGEHVLYEGKSWSLWNSTSAPIEYAPVDAAALDQIASVLPPGKKYEVYIAGSLEEAQAIAKSKGLDPKYFDTLDATKESGQVITVGKAWQLSYDFPGRTLAPAIIYFYPDAYKQVSDDRLSYSIQGMAFVNMSSNMEEVSQLVKTASSTVHSNTKIVRVK